MKVLKFNTEYVVDPIKVNKHEVVEYHRNGNIEIVLNGIITHIISSEKYKGCQSDELKSVISNIISYLINSTTPASNKHKEVAIDGTYTICGEEYDGYFIFCGIKTTPVYEYE